VFIRADPCPTETKIKSIPIHFFQSTIVNHKSSIPMRPPLHARSTGQRYRWGVRLLASVFLNTPFWGQNDAFKAQNDPYLKLFWYDYSVIAWPDPKGINPNTSPITCPFVQSAILMWRQAFGKCFLKRPILGSK
jgi:hypothetical protein